MCGRYSHSKEHRYDVHISEYQIQIIFGRKFNIAPTHRVPVIVLEDSKPVLKTFQWGLVPFWSKEPKMSFSMINAKAETLNSKPTWKRLLQKQRCLVPADAFYEWEGVLGKKMPWRFTLKGDRPFCFAGLWDKWSDANQELETFTIITTSANKMVNRIHDRMPVLLHDTDYAAWLNEPREDLLRPFPDDEMEEHRANPWLNKVGNDSEKCLEPWQ